MSTFITRFAAAAVLGIIVVPAWCREEKSTAASAPQVEGTYLVVSIERDGRPLPAEQYTGDTVQITKDKITTCDKAKKEILVLTYKLDSSTKPCKISTVSLLPIRDMKSSGLIEVGGDTIRLVTNLGEGPVPTAFKAGKDQQLVLLKRMENK